MLGRVGDSDEYGTRRARLGLAILTRDHQSVGYRVPKEWGVLTEAQRGVGSLAAFERGLRGGFLAGYGAFMCEVERCVVCARGALG